MPYHRTTSLPPLMLFLILALFSCKREVAVSDLDEGIVKFNVTYLQDKVGGYSQSVLPQSMIIHFKDNQMKTSVEGALGFFRLINIADLNDHRNTTYLKFLDKKYIFEGRKRETACCFGVLNDMEVEFTGKTKTIAGFTCEEAIASFPESGYESFPIYFTREIQLRKPNSTSPYREIPGFMLEFNTTMGSANMHLIAESYKPEQVNDDEFVPPTDYRPVSKTEIENILHALMK